MNQVIEHFAERLDTDPREKAINRLSRPRDSQGAPLPTPIIIKVSNDRSFEVHLDK